MGLQIVAQVTGQMSLERAHVDAVLLMCSGCQDSMTDLKGHSDYTYRLDSDLLILTEEMRKSCRIR
jgi:hypothetical protein